MASFVKITEAGSMALHAGAYLAARPGRVCSAGEMARALRVSPAHLVKVLERLARAGLVRPSRGPKGGFVLAQAPGRITLRNIFEAIEGRMAPVACLMKQSVCKGRDCILGSLVRQVNRQTMVYLTDTTLKTVAGKIRPAQTSGPNRGKQTGNKRRMSCSAINVNKRQKEPAAPRT